MRNHPLYKKLVCSGSWRRELNMYLSTSDRTPVGKGMKWSKLLQDLFTEKSSATQPPTSFDKSLIA